MWRHALLYPLVWVTNTYASPNFHIRQFNSTLSSTDISSSTSSRSTSDGASVASSQGDALTSTLVTPSTFPSLNGPDSLSNSTRLSATNHSISSTPVCTGCVLEAIKPTTISYDGLFITWLPVPSTVTVINRTITYMDGTTIDTVVTEFETVTRNVTLPANHTNVLTTTPIFTWVPVVGTTITLNVGPTYVAYTDLYGGLDFAYAVPTDTEDSEPTITVTDDSSFEPWPKPTNPLELQMDPSDPAPTCDNNVTLLPIYPTETRDYHFFIQTYPNGAPSLENTAVPLTLPASLIQFLKLDPTIASIYRGSDIATCTLRATTRTTREEPPPASTPPPLIIGTTSQFFSTTYQSTSTHVTRQGCLRCVPGTQPTDGPAPIQPPDNNPPDNRPQPPDDKPQSPDNKETPQNPPQSQIGPGDGQSQNDATDLPGLIASIITDPQFTARPQPPTNNNNNDNDGQRVTIGDGVVQIRPAQPTPNQQQNQPNQQQQNPGVVIGSETLRPGQTTTINGVQVAMPSQGNGNSIVVDGSTILVNPAPTRPPVLTVGQNTITANSRGQFIVGTQTLAPGGPPITVDGSTLSLGPSGTIAVVNGVTQTLGNAPFATNAPALTVNGQVVTATVVGGTTRFVLGPGRTLTPGGVLTVDGTTFSMPQDGSGSTIVVNGVTSTLEGPGLPVVTLGAQPVTASVVDGTTAFVLGPGQTLTPGGVITVSGTTFSMPASASGSVIVVNGVTSTLGQPLVTAAAALTIDGKTYSATVRDGTTEYVLDEGTTLRPGEAITISGTTYSLDSKGTALVIKGKTSSIPKTPASNSASTTASSSSSSSTTTTSLRDPGNFIASGIGISSKKGGAGPVRGGLDKWAESVVVAIAGWMFMLI